MLSLGQNLTFMLSCRNDRMAFRGLTAFGGLLALERFAVDFLQKYEFFLVA